jgi:GntR family transcriptional regulator
MRISATTVKPGGGPAHAQIESWLREQIDRGRLPRGSRLPPERALSERLGVSRMTLRHALESLERRGLVERRVGRDGGTFVAEPKLELAGTSALSDQLRGLGLQAGARVLSAEEREASGEETILGRRVVAIHRVRLADGDPVALERTAFPGHLYPGLLEGPLDGSLYELIRSRYADVPVRAVERLEAALADVGEAAALGIEPGAPVMLVERVAYGADGTALEHSCDVFRGDRTRVAWESEIPGRP